MRSGNILFITGLLFILITDTLWYLQLKSWLNKKWQKWVYLTHSLFFVALLTVFHLSIPRLHGPEAYIWLETVIGLIFLFYTPKLVAVILNALAWITGLFSPLFKQILRKISWATAISIFLILLYSMSIGRYNYKTETIQVHLENLPPAFSGYKVVQLSDIHLGSFGRSYRGVSRLVREVNALQPDLIVFTGDMVNNFASEMTPWINVMKELRARDGKYAVMGNHDYGDYTQWPTPEAKAENRAHFAENMRDMGFRMLNNENIPLINGHDTIYLAGSENWGKPPFPRYGSLKDAVSGLDEDRFVILLSHDPSHWQGEVIGHQNIHLTLSGHTHAMQAGLQVGNWKWSPAQYIYPEYDGLYRHDNQYLYVSRGQGYLGFPGRVGLRPVITELILTGNGK